MTTATLHDRDVVIFFDDREQCHGAILKANEIAKGMVATATEPKRWRLIVGEHYEDITVKQRGFLHVAVFPQIAEQYTFPDGSRYAWQVWKEHFRARFLGDRWVPRAVPRWNAELGVMVQPKRKTPHRERVSTEDLKTVKAYSDYIDKVIDTAVLELGVTFDFNAQEREAVRYKRPARAPRREAVTP